MPIKWSRIHAELGESPTALTYAMVDRAVRLDMAETDDLEWKRALPQGPDKKLEEFAKDLAAMANTGGGLIVYGVSEDADERADELLGVANGKAERQTLHSYAARWVRPLIGDLAIESLDDGRGGPGLIVVFVTASPDAPHVVVYENNRMGVPYRYGPHTNWMSEHELERAYRDRFSRRADDRAALVALLDGLKPEIDQDKGVWLALAAQPVLSPPPRTSGPDRQNAIKAILDAEALAGDLTGDTSWFRKLLGLSDGVVANPRTGLRRWRFRSYRADDNLQASASWPVVELHHNGGVALAVELTSTVSVPKLHDAHWVPVRVMDLLIGAGVALASSHSRTLGITGTIMVRADLLTSGSAPSRHLIAVERVHPDSSSFERVGGSAPVRVPAAVEATFTADSDITALRDAARQLAEDLNHQFGKPDCSLP
ncbi:AlbA family DNA-binding domain-containing protein [Amycolatopsis alba]|uniref:ATP-binding protein n=1 Tax=Amycolatopsis alba DSM 44262 TaxID=1125972 RepID=A0A229RFD2_AMYAL|nr:ATP-binding protein [Amycolatopsis alba]OXM45357.1 ATP-binding protein [Amycolatopsis alba DSM 44262]